VSEAGYPLLPIPRSPLYEQVADRLRALIDIERLVPGDRLPAERDLAARLGVSRGSVRQGLTVLRVMGLVEIRHGMGVYLLRPATDVIPPISLRSLGDEANLPALSDVRAVLEGHAARLAARNRTAADLAAANDAVDAMEAAVAAGGDGLEGDRRFHATIVAAADNPVLAELLSGFDATIRRIAKASLQREGQPPRSLATHRLILDAITRGDEEQAGTLMRDHLAVTGAMDAGPA
jgi:GntR family transcriptional repressor for pyruvate dehydrogenase complex